MKNSIYILISFSIIVFTACQKNSETHTSSGVEIIETKGNESYAITSSDYLFNQDTLHSFYINLPENALAYLDADPAAEEYVEGSITFNGETVSPIGIRYKGSVGAFANGTSGKNWTNPSGHKIVTKLSLKLKINWLDENKTFYGLKKLQFHSINQDPSQMRDRLGYWLFREMGVIAPRSVHAKIYINGQYQGLYAFVEQIDDQFVKENFNDKSGNLYKEIWPILSDGNTPSESTILYQLKTPRTPSTNSEIFRSFGQSILDAEDMDSKKEIFEQKLNMNQMMAYAVVDRMIRNDDGVFHWYCGFTRCSNHNYYWYTEPSTGKLYLIPWDLDNAFENIIENANPVTPIGDDWGTSSNNCEPYDYTGYGILQKSAMCDPFTAVWMSFENEFESTKTSFKNGPFSKNNIEEQITKWYTQIEDATIEANKTHEDAISLDEWNAAVITLISQIEHSRTNF